MNPYHTAMTKAPIKKFIKPLSLFFFAIALSTITFAQGFHVGLKGGVNMYKIEGKSFNEEFKHSYNAGLFTEINFSPKVGIQPEIIWNQAQTQTSTRFKD